jgi:bacillithiol synthase
MMRIPFGRLPSMSALFLDYVTDWSRVQKFYPQPFSLEAIAAFARQRKPLDRAHRDRLCAGLTGNAKSIEKLAAGAAAVITGQQAQLFAGPNYTILKILTVIKLAKALDSAGVPAVPVFWIAAEDHDYQEIESATVLDRDSGLSQVRVELTNPDSAPVGWLKFREDVSVAVSKCLSSLPESEFQGQVRELLESSYRPEVSPVEAFRVMLEKLFAGTALVVANPLNSELRRLAQPTLVEAVRRNSEIRSAVIARSRDLSDAGYHEQVKVDGGFTGLFAYRQKSRQALKPEELREDIQLSANVLLRPAMQDSIFPTAAYIGGPAEVAYFAQAGAVYQALGRPVPPVMPRISATILESRIARALNKYEMNFLDVFRGRDFLRRKAVASVQGVEVFDTVRDQIGASLDTVRPALQVVDPTLGGALDTARQKILHQIEGLRTKFVNAEARRNETLERHLEAITNSVFPEKKLQERVVNVNSFLVRYGLGFIQRLEEVLSLDSREHQVIEI